MMSEFAKISTDVASLVDKIVSTRMPIAAAMSVCCEYCCAIAPGHARIWRELESLDYRPGCREMTQWIQELLTKNPPSDHITALWFGLYNPTQRDGSVSCDLYCAGSSRFNPSDPFSGWHCSPEYWPEGRYANSTTLDTIYRMADEIEGDDSFLGEAVLCHGYVGALLTEWCYGELRSTLLGEGVPRAIAMGHDSGGMHLIYRPSLLGL